MFERHFVPTFEATAASEATLVVHETAQHAASGIRFTEGWSEQVRQKLIAARDAASTAGEGEPFAMCDADLVFLGLWVGPALASLDGRGLVAMGEPDFSPAFWLARSTPRLRAMLDELVANWDSWGRDGQALIDGLRDFEIETRILDSRFANPGILGHPLPLVFGRATFSPPPGTLMFHANFCELQDKDRLLSEVRRLSDGGERIPNEELYVEGPEGLGFFPAKRPDRPFDRQTMLDRSQARDILSAVGDRPVSLIVEVGSWLGGSTRWFLETFSGPRHKDEAHEHARIICIDTWGGLAEWDDSEVTQRIGSAWEQFAANCWHLRQWITPVKLRSHEGLPAVAAELARQQQEPDLVYIDGDHSFEMCTHDVLTSADAWPNALVIGDDAMLERAGESHELPVREAVLAAAERLGRSAEMHESGIWVLGPAPRNHRRYQSERS